MNGSPLFAQGGWLVGPKEISVNRVVGQYFSAEMAVLCLVEWALTSVVIYALLIFAAGSGAPLVHAGAGSLAVLLALTIGTIAVTIGLYRPELCLERGRLLVNASVVGVLAFPALLLVSGTLEVDLNRLYLLWLGKGLVAEYRGLLQRFRGSSPARRAPCCVCQLEPCRRIPSARELH